jgi:hypothetical protein
VTREQDWKAYEFHIR